MAVQRLDIHRRDRGERALVTLVGDIWPASAPLLRAALEQCLRDGMTAIDVDLTTVGSCDAKGLDVFLAASRHAGRVHACLHLHHPCAQITRLLAFTGSAPLLRDLLDPSAAGPSAGGTQTSGDRAGAPVVKDGIRLRRLTRRQVEGMSEDIADLAVAGPFLRDDFLRRLAVSARRPGFALLVAETTVLVGCVFGFPVSPVSRSEQGLQESVQRLTGCARFLLLTQVVAHQHPQRRDIGRRLQQRLLADERTELGVALLNPADRAGQAAYDSWGWRNHGEMVGLPGRGAPCVLTLFRGSGPSLPAPRAARPGRA
ncbi:STAS domain-containing protein [Streptomyces cynarae]|uniref:STAS domain-containing protein n=1 Tax=Streptomyces cynarae TaxID=2981134 RepID=A0ABY6E2T1_9ACTN|nr:STAS domain-containing protein [Streptomyces cynarae]UXY20703.1 STAS domain-containing protein [Streptomyces cynarae]